METLTPNLGGRDIVMISDYVDDYDDEDIKEEEIFLQAIRKQVEEDGSKFYFIEVKTLKELDDRLSVFNPETVVVFNWCEEVFGKQNSGDVITKFLEDKGFVFTGANTETLKLNQNKVSVKRILEKNGVSTPKYFIAEKDKTAEIPDGFEFPLIVKTTGEHGSLGITDSSVVKDHKHLDKQIEFIHKNFGQDAMVEEFIDGPEYLASVWGNNKLEMLPVMEIDYSKIGDKEHKLQNYDSKWDKSSNDFNVVKIKLPEDLTKAVTILIEENVLKTFKATKCRTYARIELRVKDGIPYIIDVNANPSFLPHVSFLESAKLAGYNYGRTVEKICEFALNSK